MLSSPLNLSDPSGATSAWWGTVPPTWMCGYVPPPLQGQVHMSSSACGVEGFVDAIGSFFEAIGDAVSGLFGGGPPAPPKTSPAPPDPALAVTRSPTYADIESASLPSATSAVARAFRFEGMAARIQVTHFPTTEEECPLTT